MLIIISDELVFRQVRTIVKLEGDGSHCMSSQPY